MSAEEDATAAYKEWTRTFGINAILAPYDEAINRYGYFYNTADDGSYYNSVSFEKAQRRSFYVLNHI